MSLLTSAMLLIVGIIHLLPLSGASGAARLGALYGGDFAEPNLAILMRHRAVLFGLLGAFIVLAAFAPTLQALALVAGFVSVGSFLVIARSVGSYNPPLARVVTVDLIALACLILATAGYLLGDRP
jgi:hypothetical protein